MNDSGLGFGEALTFTTDMAIQLPSVTTVSVTDVTATTAKATGNVSDDGGSTVTERGICWSTSSDPTTQGSHQASGTGTGSFMASMTGLAPGTTYHVRAYATNTQGTSYGNDVAFTTSVTLPFVNTSEPADITQTTALCGGEVTEEGGATVTERGVCWSTSLNPTTADSHQAIGSGLGSFSCTLNGLAPGTTYHVRAYATNSAGTAYGKDKQFTTPAYAPTVTTSQVTNITQTTATGGGKVTSDGGATVTERGICWSTTQNPTISNSHQASGSGTGSFTCTLDGLAPATTYHVRAYATNSAGTNYGNDVTFRTAQDISSPTVTTGEVTNITQTTAQCGGNVTSDGGAAVTERGICWSTSHNPTTNGSHATNGTGTGAFIVQMTGLTTNTTYYVRAYAINSAGIAYGEEVNFTTLDIPQGAIDGLFTINSNGDQIYFSQGNLQYRASTNTWQFAADQWDYIGDDNANISSSYSGWIDLFGWGTSGYNHGAVCYQPWSTSLTDSDYYAYGSDTYNLYDQTGQADWGYNAIRNGGNMEHYWRTLTFDEWYYVFDTRSTPSGIRYAKATVNGVNGVILVPDDWSASTYSLSSTNNGDASFSSNTISQSVWTSTLEPAGCVFLPAAGGRLETSVYYVESRGCYWSASYIDSARAYRVCFSDSDLCPATSQLRDLGYCVRLVADSE